MDNKPNNKNTIFMGVAIGIITILLIVGIIFLVSSKKSSTPSAPSASSSTSESIAAPVVKETEGSVDATTNCSFNIRSLDFSKTINQVKSFEKSQKDTNEDMNYVKSNDGSGISYLFCYFNEDSKTEFFDAPINTANSNALISYTFYGKKLKSFRIQYGETSEDTFNTVINNATAKYGNHTYYRTLSNGAKEYWWNTKNNRLIISYSVITQYSGDGSASTKTEMNIEISKK